MRPGAVRWVFDSIVQLSRLVRVHPFGSEASLATDLDVLSRAYNAQGIDDILSAAFDDRAKNGTGYYATTEDYYTDTEAQLSGVHCPAGAVHFGLDWDGQYRSEGFYEQARLVGELIAERGARDVLEVGSGKGFNTIHLARQNPNVHFTGVDLTPAHVRIASERGRGLSNLRFVEGDFHDLQALEDASVDLAFEVEAGCYSDTPAKVGRLLSELHRVLRPGGVFVAFDYVRADAYDELSAEAKLAVDLVARAWVIEGFVPERAWNAEAERAGLTLTSRRDLREAAMPSVLRLYRQARMFYLVMASPVRALPAKLVRRSTHNAVSALMLPHTFALGALEYRQARLEKAR